MESIRLMVLHYPRLRPYTRVGIESFVPLSYPTAGVSWVTQVGGR